MLELKNLLDFYYSKINQEKLLGVDNVTVWCSIGHAVVKILGHPINK